MRAPTRNLPKHRHPMLSVVTAGALASSVLLGVAAAPAAAMGGPAYHLPKSPLSGGLLMARAVHAGLISIPGGHPSGVSQGRPLLTARPDAEASGPGAKPANSAVIAASPTVRGLLLSGSNDYNCSSLVGLYVSKDNGATWPNRACMPGISGLSGAGFPEVAWDRLGNAYGTGIEFASDNSSSVYITKSSNKGATWNAPVLVQPPDFASGNADAPRLQADVTATSPHVNCLYVSATQFDTRSDSQIDVSHSCDGGTTWSTPVPVTPLCSYPSCVVQFSAIAIDKAGNVDATWMGCAPTGSTANCGGTVATIYLARSTDGGITWGAPIAIGSDALAPDTCGAFYGCLPNTNERVSDIPQIDVARSGPHTGRMYVVDYTWTGSVMQVRVRHSNVDMTWSAPVAVAPPETRDQFSPWLAVDHRACKGCGEVGVSWLDRKNDPSNVSYQAFAAVSSDGVTFSAPLLISTGGLESPFNDGFGGGFMGDYSGAFWSYKKSGTKIVTYYHAAWTDTRNGTAQTWVGGLSIP